MSTSCRLILALFIMVCGFSGCTSTATFTLSPATSTPSPATNTPLPVTASPSISDTNGIHLEPPPSGGTPQAPTPTLDPTVKRALFVIFDQFADKEYNIPSALLQDDGIVISVASSTLDRVRSSGGKYVRPDLLLSEVNTADYAAIIFVGSENYEMDNADAMRIAQEAAAQNKVLGAICAAPITLARAGVLHGKRATSSLPPSLLKGEGAIDTGAVVERDGFIITANGPGASQAFGEALVTALREFPLP